MTPAARRLRAFTLLEVMAAVLVLGMLYAMLAQAAIQGLRSEGVSRRKVEASLIADRFLADLEAKLALGDIPKTGAEEQEVDVYRVGVSVQPYDPTPILDAIEAVEKQRGVKEHRTRSPDRDKPSSIEVGAEGQEAPTEDLLKAPRTGEDGRLRRIDVSVTWQDGDREERVLRTTFAFDTTGLEALFPKKGANTGAAGAEEDGGDKAGDAKSGGTQKGGSNKGGKKKTPSNGKPTTGNPTMPQPGRSGGEL